MHEVLGLAENPIVLMVVSRFDRENFFIGEQIVIFCRAGLLSVGCVTKIGGEGILAKLKNSRTHND